MADKTENIKTRLSFDGEAEYKAACKEINSTLKVLNSEMKLVTAEYRDNANSAEALKAKQSVLQRTYDEQAKKVAETERAYESMVRQYGETSSEAQDLETQLHKERAALYDVENQLADTERATSAAVLAQKQYEEHCKQINENITQLSSKLKVVAAEYKGNESKRRGIREKTTNFSKNL